MFKMRFLIFEQLAIIKFLTYEGNESFDIFKRIENIYGKYTLKKDKIYKFNSIFTQNSDVQKSCRSVYNEVYDRHVDNSGLNFNLASDFDKNEKNKDIVLKKPKRCDTSDSMQILEDSPILRLKPCKRAKMEAIRDYTTIKKASVDWPVVTPTIQIPHASNNLPNDSNQIEKDCFVPIRQRRRASLKSEKTWRIALRKELTVQGEPDEIMGRTTAGPTIIKAESVDDELEQKFDSFNNSDQDVIENLSDIEESIRAHEQWESEIHSGCEDPVSDIRVNFGDLFLPPVISIVENGISPEQIIDRVEGVLVCMLCPLKQFPFRSRAISHARNVHFKGMASFGNVLSLRCKQHCYPIEPPVGHEERSHYHCPYCTWYDKDTRRLFKHAIKAHINHPKKKAEKIMKKNLHKENEFVRCICVDPVEGVYLVPKLSLASSEPVHIQKKLNEMGDEVQICSQQLCRTSMSEGKKAGVKRLTCKHIKKADISYAVPAQSFEMDENHFETLGLESETKWHCQFLTQLAKERDVSAVVEWTSSERLIYLSVISDDENDLPFGRVFVKCDPERNYFVCSHSDRDHTCPHIIFSKIYMGLA